LEQKLLLQEMSEAYYIRKAREDKREQYLALDIPNDLSSKKKMGAAAE
jgi:hypothetical protein